MDTIVERLAFLTILAVSAVHPSAAEPGTPPIQIHYGHFGLYRDKHFRDYSTIYLSDGSKSMGDLGFPVVFCPRDSEFFCMNDGRETIAVPRRDLKVGETWTFSGRTFSVEPNTYSTTIPSMGRTRTSPTFRFSVLGLNADFSVVRINRLPDDKRETAYLWSPANGIIGWCSWQADAGTADANHGCVWLAEEHGLGSSHFEKAIPDSVRISEGTPRYVK